MIMHKLKIKEKYAERIELGSKRFEIRKNDRDFQVGDTIQFNIIDRSSHNENVNLDMFEQNLYNITYIHTGLGLDEGYCVLGISL